MGENFFLVYASSASKTLRERTLASIATCLLKGGTNILNKDRLKDCLLGGLVRYWFFQLRRRASHRELLMQVPQIGYWRCIQTERAYRISRTASLCLHGIGGFLAFVFWASFPISLCYLQNPLVHDALVPADPGWHAGPAARWPAASVRPDRASGPPFQCADCAGSALPLDRRLDAAGPEVDPMPHFRASTVAEKRPCACAIDARRGIPSAPAGNVEISSVYGAGGPSLTTINFSWLSAISQSIPHSGCGYKRDFAAAVANAKSPWQPPDVDVTASRW